MNCTYCHSELPSGAVFCLKCGTPAPDQSIERPSKSGGTLIVALLIFVFVAAGGVVSYLYFFAEPKREVQEQKAADDQAQTKPLDKDDQQVPMPDAGPSQSSQPSPPQQKQQDMPQPGAESSTPQEQPAPEAPSQDKPIAEPPADIVNPVLIHRVNPEYPEVARRARVQGIVILEAIITKDGTVENVRVLRGVHPILDQAAIDSVKQWRYKPATLNGTRVKVYSTVTVKFTLKQ